MPLPALREVRCPKSHHLLFQMGGDARTIVIELTCKCGRVVVVRDGTPEIHATQRSA